MGRHRLLLLLIAGPLLLAGCGDEEGPSHGLKAGTFESNPKGDAIEVRYANEDHDSYVARITMTTRFSQKRRVRDETKQDRGQGTAEIELRQLFARPGPDRPLTSAMSLRYVKAVGRNAETYLARKPITGRMLHEANGRPKHETLRLEGGTTSEQVEAMDMIGGLMFAGFGGSPTWLPPRPVRVGEAWQLQSFLRPRSLENILLQAKRVGMAVPDPSFSGTARLEKTREGDDGLLLEVSLDALLQIHGKFSKDGRTGHMSVGDRVKGRAVISARTGLPISFRVTHTGSKQYRTGGDSADQEFTSEIEGRVSSATGQ